jgi:hypothetical protein
MTGVCVRSRFLVRSGPRSLLAELFGLVCCLSRIARVVIQFVAGDVPVVFLIYRIKKFEGS